MKIKVETAVDSAAFVAFYDVFQQYQKAFSDQPAEWEKVAGASKESATDFASAAKSVRALADSMDKVLGNSKKIDTETKKTLLSWSGLAKATKSTAKNIGEATESLLKWAGITGIVGGLVGGGALFGIATLARGVADNRSSSMGLGTSYGGQNAFRTNFGRLQDVDAVLGGVNEATHDSTKRQGLYALGLTDQDMKGDTSDVAALAIVKLKELVDKLPEGDLQNQLQARKVTDVFSLEYAERVKHTRRSEIDELAQNYRRDKPSMELDSQTQKRWQDLTTQLGRSKTGIENTFVKELVRLDPGLAHLSDEIVKLVDILFAKGGSAEHWLDELNTGLEWLAEHISKPEFKEEVDSFIKGVEQLAKDMWEMGKSVAGFVHWLAQLVGEDVKKHTVGENGEAGGDTGGATPAPVPLSGSERVSGRGGTGLRRAAGATPHADAETPSVRPLPARGGQRAGTRGKWWTDERMKHAYDRMIAAGIKPMTAEAMIARSAFVEAGSGPTADNGSHHGLWQWDRNRGGYSVGDNFDDQIDHGIHELKTTEERARRLMDTAKSPEEAAAYMGAFERGEGFQPGGVEDKWSAKTAAGMAAVHAAVRPTPRVVIHNAPGTDPSKQAAAMVAPQ